MKLYQASTLNALMLGNFDQTVTVKEFMNEADTGIGTYTGLNGEAIFVKGVAYNAMADGTVKVMKPEEGVAFGTVVRFDEKAPVQVIRHGDLNTLKSIKVENSNVFYMMKAEHIHFKTMHVRSCYPSTKPYPTLSEVACDQREYHYENIEGTLVAIYCPQFVDGINLPGWHLHFLSEDKTKGGHILGLSFDEFAYKLNEMTEFDLVLPKNPEFASLNLCEDLKAKTAAVEG